MNSVMKSFIIVVVIWLAIVHAQAADAQMTREQAVSILIQQVIEPSPNKDELMAFGPQNMLQPGDIVRPHRIGSPTYPGQPKTIERPTWFFFLNDRVEAGYVHQTRFLYIDANNPNPTMGDGISVDIQGWWPVINEQDYYDSQYPKEHPDWVYGDRPPIPEVILEKFLKKSGKR